MFLKLRCILIFLDKQYFYVPKNELQFHEWMRCILIFLDKQYFNVPKNKLHLYEWRGIERMVLKAAYMKGIIKNVVKCAQEEEEVMDMTGANMEVTNEKQYVKHEKSYIWTRINRV